MKLIPPTTVTAKRSTFALANFLSTMMLSLILVMLCAGVLNAATKNVPAEQPTIQAGADNPSHPRSLRDFLKPDGSVDFDAVRHSGHEGSLDLRGLDVGLDPVTGAPRVQASAAAGRDPDDQYWHDLPGGPDAGIDGTVEAFAVYNGHLIAGGEFTTAGGVSVNNIARWDGAGWQPLASGTDGAVFTLTVFDGKLIAGGWFTHAGGTSANYVAQWDGTSWQLLAGLYGPVLTLAEYNGELIAGGMFYPPKGTLPYTFIARWDGSHWQMLGSGVDYYVHDLVVFDGELIAGGKFSFAGGYLSNHIARWDGANWRQLGSGMNDDVWSLV